MKVLCRPHSGRLICLTVRFECGLRKEALEYIRRKWEPMLPAGTFWENYPVPNSELSCSHAWSAHPISHLPELIFVLKQLEANWKKIRLEPVSLLKHAAFFIPLISICPLSGLPPRIFIFFIEQTSHEYETSNGILSAVRPYVPIDSICSCDKKRHSNDIR